MHCTLHSWKQYRNVIKQMNKGSNVEAEIKRAADLCANLSGMQHNVL